MKFARDSWPARAATAAALALTLLFGNGWFVTGLTTTVGELAIPGAIGLPSALPGLRLWPLGETHWWHTASETIAAIGFIAVVGWWMFRSRPSSGPARLLLTGWSAALVAIICADLWRVVSQSFTQDLGLGGYLGYLLAAVIYGTLWGILTGWLVGAAAVITDRIARRAEPENEAAMTKTSEEPADTAATSRSGVTDSPP